ncbi:Predicted N-acetyltransferase YhbS [Arthrobacter sp. ov407]|uniref:GNAT family N-acetyltransferase n=1 Tax=Arthrobacter sp. ov407 TaxID=1761748 RepID=UPI0008807544|nr:GNAT family N-acetyltransferase [Arthrobacter sp. ov407]SDL58421.1 Predicted N-acetyltransferase YhbS [Arthrobacter sp. ov407]
MTLHIRLAAPTDNAAIEQIENAADQLLIDRLTPHRWEPAPAGGSRAAEPGYILVAEETEGSAVIGFVHVLEHDQAAHMEQLSVLPEHGRRGHGRALVEAAKNEARRRGYECISLRTYAEVPWNGPFYARVGFVETKPVSDFHKHLAEVEERFGLDRYGRRIQMTAALL